MEINFENFPDEIREIIKGKKYSTNDIGMSGSTIIMFDNLVLKIVYLK